jgi:hypothetical protein
MTKQEAIRRHCLECAGNSHKEVTLCQLFDCSLWPWRTGQHVSSRDYADRVTKAFRNYPDEIAELVNLGIDISKFGRFLAVQPQQAPVAEKNSDGLGEVPGERVMGKP